MLVHRRLTSGIQFAATYLYIWAGKGTVRVKGLAQAQELNSVSTIGLEHGPLDPETSALFICIRSLSPFCMIYCSTPRLLDDSEIAKQPPDFFYKPVLYYFLDDMPFLSLQVRSHAT